jgi:quercetin dioxygenase-like cupin family protein
MSLFDKIFNNENSETYLKAKSCLSKVKERINDFADVYPDITPYEFIFIKDKWVDLPLSIGVGVSVMGIDMNDRFITALTYFKENAFLLPREHPNSFEHNTIIKGEIYNKTNGDIYKEGDSFIIRKNEKHYLYANKETQMMCVLSENEDLLTPPKITYNLKNRFSKLNQV